MTSDASSALTALRGRLFATVREAAELLEADERTVRRAIEAGEIPAVRLGPNSVRIRVVPFLQQVAGLTAEELRQLGFLETALEQHDADPVQGPASKQILTIAKENRDPHAPPGLAG